MHVVVWKPSKQFFLLLFQHQLLLVAPVMVIAQGWDFWLSSSFAAVKEHVVDAQRQLAVSLVGEPHCLVHLLLAVSLYRPPQLVLVEFVHNCCTQGAPNYLVHHILDTPTQAGYCHNYCTWGALCCLVHRNENKSNVLRKPHYLSARHPWYY